MAVSNYLDVMTELFAYKPEADFQKNVNRLVVTISSSGEPSTNGKRIQMDGDLYSPQRVHDILSKVMESPCFNSCYVDTGFSDMSPLMGGQRFYLWLKPTDEECSAFLSGKLMDMLKN